MRVIGIDLGSKRIGIALSDSDLTVATPLDVIERSGNVENDHIAILKITDEWEVKRIIVGLPISLDGTLGASAQSVIDEIKRLGSLTDIPIETHDERFTTVTAEQILLQQNVKRDKKKRVIDKVAAAIILQGWIDSFNKSKDARSWDSYMSGDNEELERSDPQSQSVYPDTDPEDVTQREHNVPYKNFFLGAYAGSKETTYKGNSSSKDIYPQDLPPWYEDEYYDDRDWERLPRRTSTAIRFGIFIGVLLVLSLVTYSFVKGWIDDQLDPPGEPGIAITVEIPQGASADDIARILADNDVVANATVFRYYLRFKSASDFQAGIYTFQINSSAWDVKEILLAGPMEIPDDRYFVTIPEGLTLVEMQETLLSQLPDFNPDELKQAIENSETPSSLGLTLSFIKEGIFFPDTYDVDEASLANEESLLQRMTSQFDIVATETGLANPPSGLGVNPYEVLIVASLIEEEAALDEERAKIARVIYNRLDRSIPLGIDATIVYALGGDRELTLSDLAVDSPYNTRLVSGLPPTPISAPGRASIEAALQPAQGDWLYYVRTDESGVGSHTFTVTQEDFNEAVLICIERDLGCG